MVMQNIRTLKIGEVKIDKIIEVVKNKSFLSEKNRNLRIAEAIKEVCDLDLSKVQSKVKELYSTRAKCAHSTKELCEIKENLDFLKNLFQVHLYLKYSFVKLNLH